MTKWNTAVGDTFVSHTSLRLLTVSIPFFSFGLEFLSMNDELLGKLPLCTFSVFLLKHVDILLSLRGTSN